MKKVILILSIFSLFFFSVPVLVQAQAGKAGGGEQQAGKVEPVKLDNPLDAAHINTPQDLIAKVINSVLGIVGSLALVMFIYGGILWMTSSGSAYQVKKGRDILLWAAVGLVVIFSAYGLVRFVIVGVGAG